MIGTEDTPQDATALLVSYAAGTATEQERAAVEAETAKDPALAARLALVQASQGAITASETEQQDGWSPGEFGYRRLMREIEREAPPKRARLVDSAPFWRGVAAMAAAVALVVAGAWRFDGAGLAPGGAGPGVSGYTTATDGAQSAAIVQITFAATATEAEIRALLLEANARLVDGPTAVGLYRAAFDDEAAREAGLARMGASEIVDSVQIE